MGWKPDPESNCAIDSESTVFLAQPRETIWKLFFFKSLIAVYCHISKSNRYQRLYQGKGAKKGVGDRRGVLVGVSVMVGVGVCTPDRVKTRWTTCPNRPIGPRSCWL